MKVPGDTPGTTAATPTGPAGAGLCDHGQDSPMRCPVPDVSRTPLHRRALDDVRRVLRTHTNLRAVDDPESDTGYRLEPGPFPGWAHPPEW